MFTGIIEETGIIKKVNAASHSSSIWIKAGKIMKDLKLGDSVAVNGVCLTVAKIENKQWQADVMPETMKRSNLGLLRSGDTVNLERAMKADGRFGGHLVSGHIDGIGKIVKIKKEENAVIFEIETAQKLLNYMIEKGSIAIDGISLTITFLDQDSFGISVIPHTLKETVLGLKNIGDTVNLENDLIGKYIEKFIRKEAVNKEDKPQSRLTMEFLEQSGF